MSTTQSLSATGIMAPSVARALDKTISQTASYSSTWAGDVLATDSPKVTLTQAITRTSLLAKSQPCNASDARCVGVASLGGATTTQVPSAGVSASLTDTASGGSSTSGGFVNAIVGAAIGIGLFILLVLIVCLLLLRRRRRKTRHTDKLLRIDLVTSNERAGAGVGGTSSTELATDTSANYEYAFTNPIHQPRARKNANDELRMADLRSLRFAASRSASKRIKREFSATPSIPVDQRDGGCGDAAPSTTLASIDGVVVSTPRVEIARLGASAQSVKLIMDAGIVSPISSRRFMGSTPMKQTLGSSMREVASGASHSARRLFPPAGGGHLESGSRRAVVAVRRRVAIPSTTPRVATTGVDDAVAPV